MKLKVLLLFSSFLICQINSQKSDERKGRILNRSYDEALIEKQLLQEYSEISALNSTAHDTTPEDVIEEIINSSRQGRNIEGLDEIYSDLNIKEALNTGNEIEARNLIRDKLCALGLMQCDEVVHGKRPGYPTRVIYSKPPPGAVIYSQNRPQLPPPSHHQQHQQQSFNSLHQQQQSFNSHQQQQSFNRPPPQQIPTNGIYGPAKPIPFPPSQPPRKIGYAHSELNAFGSNNEKYSNTDFFEVEPNPSSSIKFGYTEKPTIVVNQGKREAGQGGVSQNHHVHHHYVHVDGNAPTGGLIDGTKTVLVNTPISEYSAVNSLSSSYQQSGFGTSGGSASNLNSNGFAPVSGGVLDYKGVNSGSSSGIYSGSSVKPIYESSQYATGNNFNKYQQSLGPQAVYTEGTNGIYSNGQQQQQQSFHSSAPDFYKKELNLNGYNRVGNGISSGSGYASQQQNYFNSQKQQQQLYSNKNQYNSIGEQYQGIDSSLQSQYDCVCVPFDQCPAQDVVGRRDDLILPLDPRNLPTEIEADGDHNSTVVKPISANNSTEIEAKKISKRSVPNASDNDDDDVRKVQGEGRLLGFGSSSSSAGYYPNQGYAPGGKKILPTLGVSFGLPVPNYPLSPYAPHIPNAHFGSLGYNGLNLGLLNVNPLFSLQVTKNEHGEKLVKPFVNLHVTPNENIIGKIGNLLLAKKGALHKHLHHHQHLHRYPPPPSPYFDGHHHEHYPQPFDHHPHHEIPPFLSHPPSHPHFGPIISDHHHHLPPPHIFSEHPPFYKDSGHGHNKEIIIDDILTNPSLLGFRSSNISIDSDYNYQSIYPQNQLNSLNFVKDDIRYARGYNHNSIDNNNNQFKQNFVQTTQAPGTSEGSEKVSFPSSRRRRDTDQPVPASIEKKQSNEDDDDSSSETDSEGRALHNGKRQAFYQPQQQQQKQCGPRAVCCRRPAFNKAPQPIQQYNRCGVRNTNGITGRIKNPSYVDGDSEFGEWPWQAAILKKDPKESVYVCGGTLIDGSYIITAAHCVKTYSGFDLRVRLGEWDVNHDVEFYPYVERDVISVHVHPEYYAGTLDNDLAILKLSAPVDLSTNPHITPACLPDKFTDFTRQRCWTTGWGKDNWDYGKYQNILKEVDVPIIEQNTCQNQLRQTRLGYNYVLNPGFICAGGEEGKDSCKGDGGGPLVCERNGVWQVVGAVSWGIGCGQQNVPGVYVRISHYLNWIQQITQKY